MHFLQQNRNNFDELESVLTGKPRKLKKKEDDDGSHNEEALDDNALNEAPTNYSTAQPNNNQ
jgi:hypothetical protein